MTSVRAQRSVDRATEHGISLEVDAPTVPLAAEVKRTLGAVTGRAICLYLCAEKALGADRETIADLVEGLDIRLHLSGQEAGFLIDDPDVRETAQVFAWGREGAAALLWAASLIDNLPFPHEGIDGEAMAELIMDAGSWQGLRLGATFRPDTQVTDEGDFYWRLYQYCRGFISTNAALPDKVNAAVVHQRTYALTWLLDIDRRGWDEIHETVDGDPANKDRNDGTGDNSG